MPFCPDCRYEYQPHIAVCPDCQAELVSKLPSEKIECIRWVEMRSFPGTVYAEMVREVFAQHSIPCLLQKDGLSSAYGSSGTGLGDAHTKIFVPVEFYARANQLLLEMADPI